MSNTLYFCNGWRKAGPIFLPRWKNVHMQYYKQISLYQINSPLQIRQKCLASSTWGILGATHEVLVCPMKLLGTLYNSSQNSQERYPENNWLFNSVSLLRKVIVLNMPFALDSKFLITVVRYKITKGAK